MTNSTTPLPDDWLSAFLDGELSDADRAQVEAWLARDASARARLETLRAVGQELRALPRAELRREASERLLESLKREPAARHAGKPAHDSRRRWAYVLATLATAAAVALLVSPRGEQDTQVSQSPAAGNARREEATLRDTKSADRRSEDVNAGDHPRSALEREQPLATPRREALPAADAPAIAAAAADAPAEVAAAAAGPPDKAKMKKAGDGGLTPAAPASAAAAMAAPDPAGELAADKADQVASDVGLTLVEVEVASEQRDALLQQLAEGLADDLARSLPQEGLDTKDTFYVDAEGSHWMVVAMDAAALLQRLEAWPQARVTSKDLAGESTATQRGAVEATRRAAPVAAPAATPAPRTLLRIR
jgi:hypothetical protein